VAPHEQEPEPTNWAELVGAVTELRQSVEGLRRDLVPRRVLRNRWLLTAGFVILVALGVVANASTLRSNQGLIHRVAALESAGRQRAYADCVVRNQRAEQSTRDLAKLVQAHRADGSRNAQRVWESYLEGLRRQPLPPCKKPTDGGG
jgi:hypothetical protein